MFSHEDMNVLEWIPEGEPIASVTFTYPNGNEFEFSIYRNTTLEQVVAAAGFYWAIKSYHEHIERQAGYQPRFRFPHQLELHLDWLYQSVVLGKTSLRISKGLPDETDEDWRSPETIKGAVNRLAKMLDIPLRRGRSPKRSKKV